MAVVNPYNYSRPHKVMGTELNNRMPKAVPRQERQATPSQQYLETKILSAKPEELTYMLYDGIVKFIKKARMALESTNYEQVNYNSLRAQAIVDELRSTLNMAVEMSQGMDSLYEYLGNCLFQANIEKADDKFKEALELAENFRDTWKEAFNIKI